MAPYIKGGMDLKRVIWGDYLDREEWEWGLEKTPKWRTP